MMLCPLKFARYEFEGGTECIGTECGFFGSVCGATNGICGETNGIHDEITLPEGDVVAIIRRALDNQRSPTFCALVRYLDISSGLSVSWHEAEDALRAIVDMVERDYVRRETYNKAAEIWQAACDEWRKRATEAEAERDEWEKELSIANAKLVGKPECEICDRATLLVEIEGLTDKIGEITDECSELMKKQPYTFDVHDVPGSLQTVGRYIDELTAERDEWKAKVKTLAGYSKYWRGRCAKLEYRSDKRAAAVERLRKMQNVDDYGDWVEAIAEVVKGTDRSNIGDYGMWESLIDLLTDDDTHSKTHSKTEPSLTEQSESLSDDVDSKPTFEAPLYGWHEGESDSREKLEADVRQILHSAYMLAWMHGYENRRGSSFEKLHREFYNLLDRQAAITEREWQESNDRLIDTMRTTSEQYREKITELQARVDELTTKLHASNAERARLRECLGIATDNAHDFLTLVDESGNVYDRDEGLA